MAYTTIQVRRDTAANWTSANPTLAAGEIGFETDTGKLKVGTGSATWTSLSYYSGASSSSTNGFQSINATTVTASGALTPSQYTLFDATSGSLTITLPTGQAAGTIAIVEKIDSTTNTVTFTGNIRDAASSSIQLVGQHETHVLEVDASGSWFVPAGHKPLSMLDSRYTAQAPGLIIPAAGSLLGTQANGSTGGVGTLAGRRYIMPRTGTLHDVGVCVFTPGGQFYLAVYDTGDATSGSRTLLGNSTVQSAPGSAQWVTWDPALSVKQGQHLDLVLIAANTAMAVAADFTTGAALASQLPSSSFMPVAGGALPKVAWSYAAGAFAAPPSTVTEAQCSTTVRLVAFSGRVA